MDISTRRLMLKVALVVGVVGGSVAAYRIYRVVEMLRIDPEAAHLSGSQFGLGKVDTHCVEAGLERAEGCWLWDKRCEMEAGLFTFGCLSSARDTGAVCEHLPTSPTMAIPNIGFVGTDEMGVGADALIARECARRGYDPDSDCTPVIARTVAYCAASGLRRL